MSTKNPRYDREQEEDEHTSEGFVRRRIEAFENRSRQPGDAATWGVVLGAFIGIMMLVSFSIGRETRHILIPLAAVVLWWIVVSKYGRVNITSILWGSATTDQKHPPEEKWIHLPTILMTLFATGSLIRNAIMGYTYSWAGIVLLVACVVYAVIYARISRILPT